MGVQPVRRFCDVLEVRDWRIHRLFVYLDPDYWSADTERYPWLTDGQGGGLER